MIFIRGEDEDEIEVWVVDELVWDSGGFGDLVVRLDEVEGLDVDVADRC